MKFPIKFKLEVGVFPAIEPLAFGFAGGIQVGPINTPALDAYTQVISLFLLTLIVDCCLRQVLIDFDDPSKTSFYLEMGKFEFKTLLKTFAGERFADHVSFISFVYFLY